jgi:hypothetical protein
MAEKPKCSVTDCGEDAYVEVILYDVYTAKAERKVFFKRDHTCPFLCRDHMVENEKGAEGERKPRGVTRYPFTNRHAAQGFTIYRPLEGG